MNIVSARHRLFLVAPALVVAGLAASCAPAAPPPAAAPAPLPALAQDCGPATTSASAVPADAGQVGSAPLDIALTAVDDEGRPSFVTTSSSDAAEQIDDLEASGELDVVALEPVQRVGLASSDQAADPVASVSAARATDSLRSNQWALDQFGIESVWSSSTGAGIDIAVVDTGVMANHVDLAGRVCSGVAYLDVSGTERPGDGATDPQGHGTHVAGIAAAAANNGAGTAGVAPDARIIPVRVMDRDGTGYSTNVARGITWAVDHGAEIINLSLGSSVPSVAIQTAVRYADSNDVLVVAAAGNLGPNGPAHYPAAFAETVAVASHEEGGAISPFSNAGNYVDLTAPGGIIISTWKNGQWTTMSGTSMATPHVAGAAALVMARHPLLSADQVRARLESTALDDGPVGHDPTFGWGLLVPSAAVGG